MKALVKTLLVVVVIFLVAASARAQCGPYDPANPCISPSDGSSMPGPCYICVVDTMTQDQVCQALLDSYYGHAAGSQPDVVQGGTQCSYYNSEGTHLCQISGDTCYSYGYPYVSLLRAKAMKTFLLASGSAPRSGRVCSERLVRLVPTYGRIVF